MAPKQNSFFAPVRTNFIKYAHVYEDDFITYSYDDSYNIDFLGCRILLWSYFFYIKTYEYYAYTSIKKLINACGCKGNSKTYKNSQVYANIKECIEWFIENKYILPLDKKSLDDFKINELIEFELDSFYFMPSIKGIDNKDHINEPFIQITKEEFDTLTLHGGRTTPRQMAVYVYIKSRCGYRYGENKVNISEYPICAWVSQETIANHFKCKQDKVSAYTKNLCDIGLLKRTTLERTSEKQPDYIYAPCIENWKEELQWGQIKYNEAKKNHKSEEEYEIQLNLKEA